MPEQGCSLGRITQRTKENPTPPSQPLFQIGGGGISAAEARDLGTIEAEIPIGEKGSAKITIPLTKVEEGDFAPFGDSKPVEDSVHPSVDEVDVTLGARIEADAEIETAFTGLAPWISRNSNWSNAWGFFMLNWESRREPGTGSKRHEASETSPETAGVKYLCAICKCSGDKECGGGRIHTIWMGKRDDCKNAQKEAQKECNHDKTFLSICDLDQKRPDGKKCMVHHHEGKCDDRETEERCKKRRK